MNIKKFNQVLSTKIAKAKSFENHGDIETAIDLWLEISDLTLKASKQSDIEFNYKHMLINKTEQIIQHIKDLKNPKKEEKIIEDIAIQEEKIQETPQIEEEHITGVETDLKKENKSSKNETTSPNKHLPQQSHKIIEKSDVNNIPHGIKEIEAPKDFRILTPHDPKYVEKMKDISEKEDLNVFKRNIESPLKKEQDSGEKSICFACGAILPPKTKMCPECGTKLS